VRHVDLCRIIPQGRSVLNPDLTLLRGKHILIVGDGSLAAENTQREIEKHGAHIMGPVRSVDLAMDLLHGTVFDAAILDLNLEGEEIYPLADALSERQIPFVFATGDERAAMARKYRGFILCDKPTALAAIAVALFAPDRFQH
jgi:CheY-like chemotaxis protein